MRKLNSKCRIRFKLNGKDLVSQSRAYPGRDRRSALLRRHPVKEPEAFRETRGRDEPACHGNVDERHPGPFDQASRSRLCRSLPSSKPGAGNRDRKQAYYARKRQVIDFDSAQAANQLSLILRQESALGPTASRDRSSETDLQARGHRRPTRSCLSRWRTAARAG